MGRRQDTTREEQEYAPHCAEHCFSISASQRRVKTRRLTNRRRHAAGGAVKRVAMTPGSPASRDNCITGGRDKRKAAQTHGDVRHGATLPRPSHRLPSPSNVRAKRYCCRAPFGGRRRRRFNDYSRRGEHISLFASVKSDGGWRHQESGALAGAALTAKNLDV